MPKMEKSAGRVREIVFPLALLVLSIGVAACGATSGGTVGNNGSSETPVTSVTTRTISRTPLPTPTSESGTPQATVTHGEVRVVLSSTSYAQGELMTVTIENGLAQAISATDHKTSCSLIQLEKLVNGVWQPVGTCRLQTPTRVVDLAAGSVTAQSVGVPGGQNAAGTYRATLSYSVPGGGAMGQSGPAHSQTFAVS